jgi:hypothetical protein
MPLQSILQALHTAGLPAGTKMFVVAVIPVDPAEPDPIPTLGTSIAHELPEQTAETAKRDRLVASLSASELNDARKAVLVSFLNTTEDEQMPFSTLTAATGNTHTASAAIGYLSHEIGHGKMLKSDLDGVPTPIQLLVTILRKKQQTHYRLTKLGRAALQQMRSFGLI